MNFRQHLFSIQSFGIEINVDNRTDNLRNVTYNEDVENNKLEVLEFLGDIELSDGTLLKNWFIRVAGRRHIIRFESNPFVINPFIHANIIENPATGRGISPIRVALVLNEISSEILNKQLDALSLMMNPPYLAPKGTIQYMSYLVK